MESDPDISACVHGRNLKQITGKAGMTEARFPNLLNKVKGLIAMNVLRKAQDNYNKKLEKMISDATKEASLEIAQYMCNKIAQTGGSSASNGTQPDTPLAPAYGIVYEVGNGMKLEDIAGRGESSSQLYDNKTGREKFEKGMEIANTALATLAPIVSWFSPRSMAARGSVHQKVTSTFDRESRTCEVCTENTIERCKVDNGFFRSSKTCNPEVQAPKCKTVQM